MTQSEWDNTPWAGSPAASNHSLVVPRRQDWVKAVTGAGAAAMAGQQQLTSILGLDPQTRAKKLLAAYRVGWFHKAGRRISQDVGALDVRLAYRDETDDGDEQAVVDPGQHVPLAKLTPEQQLLRLLTQPNPKQTGRLQRQEGQIRLDFAGATALYLEGVGQDPKALPTAIYGISPARMWDVRNNKGEIIGWIMDRDTNGRGVPFFANEIVWMSNASEQDGDIWGTSIVEAVFSEVPITSLIARHTADILTTGGRLAGMMWPKDRTLGEDEFQDALRAWRNVANDPNAARRLLMFPEPMEFSKGAATPAEIGIPELADLHQVQVLTAFPISPQMLGVPAPAGLNSGETRRWDRKEYWEGTIHPRANIMEENLQIALVSRYERIIGRSLSLTLIERNMDDAPSLVEKAGAMRALIGLGFDARDSIAAVGLKGIKWNGLPAIADPNAPMDRAQSQGAVTGGMRVLTGDTNRADRSTVQQELVGSRKALDPDAFLARLRSFLPATKAARLETGVPDGLLDGLRPAERAVLSTAIATGIRRGYTFDQMADGVPAERYEGIASLLERLGEPA